MAFKFPVLKQVLLLLNVLSPKLIQLLDDPLIKLSFILLQTCLQIKKTLFERYIENLLGIY